MKEGMKEDRKVNRKWDSFKVSITFCFFPIDDFKTVMIVEDEDSYDDDSDDDSENDNDSDDDSEDDNDSNGDDSEK